MYENPIISFNFDDDIEDQYLNGDCLNLSKKFIADDFNAEIYFLQAKVENKIINDPIHFIIKIHGYFVDIMGIWEEQSLINYWVKKSIEESSRNKDIEFKLIKIDDISIYEDSNDASNINDVFEKIKLLIKFT